jgi:hypothetical protein
MKSCPASRAAVSTAIVLISVVDSALEGAARGALANPLRRAKART